MRSEHTFLLVLLLIAALAYLLSKGAARITPPDGRTPKAAQPLEPNIKSFPNRIAEDTQGALSA